MSPRIRLSALAFGMAISLCSPAFADLKIGVTAGAVAESVHSAAEAAREKGLEVEVIEFSDWTTPNLALANGDLDLNYFQHQAFLDNAVKETGFDLVAVDRGFLSNIGLYSQRYARISDIPDGARIAIANDPVNQGRGLVLLAEAGLISLREGLGYLGTLDDITANPKNLTFVEIEGPQLVRALGDVDLAQGYPGHFVLAGEAELAGKALAYSGKDDVHFAIAFVARREQAADPEILDFIRIYHETPEVEAVIDQNFANNASLYTLPWKK